MREKLTLIDGKKGKVFPYEWVKAEATDTRLMGVVGLIVTWRDGEDEIIQIYHLDYEEYGIDGFHEFRNGDKKTIEETVQGVIGGLGGQLKGVSREIFEYLIHSSYLVDPESLVYLVDFEPYISILEHMDDCWDIDEKIEMVQSVSVSIESDIELINYFIMRAIGQDLLAMESLVYDMDVPLLSPGPFTLLKNTVTKMDKERYSVDALIDFNNHYQLYKFEVKVDLQKLLIADFSVIDSLKLTTTEASLNLKKEEFIMLFDLSDPKTQEKLEVLKPSLMKNEHWSGDLYTAFNSNNNHVKENPYYLNGDIHCLYFFTDYEELIIASFSESNLDEALDELSDAGIDVTDGFNFELKADYPILYTYINSTYDDFIDFLNVIK